MTTRTAEPPVGKLNLGVILDEDATYAITFDDGIPAGTWTAQAGAGHTITLTVTEDGNDLLVAIPGNRNREMVGNPWRLRLDGDTLLDGHVVTHRSDDAPDADPIPVILADSVPVTATVVLAPHTAADVSITAGSPAFLDASTVSAQFDTVMSGSGLSGDDVTAEKAIVTGFLVTDADDDVESRLGNAARLLQYDVVTRLQDRRRLDTVEGDVAAIEADETIAAARLAVARWAEANPQTGRYLEVCGGNTHNGRAFIYDSSLTFTTGSDVRATVMLPDITTLNRWMEILTRTADGLGSWDAYELALWMTEDHDLQVFHEHTRTGGTVEVSPFASGPGPALGVPVRVRQTTVFATGVTNVYVATVDEGDVATSDGQRWLLVGTATDPAGSTSFIANAEPWMIGAGGADVGGHMRVYDLEVRSSVDGTVIARPDIAGTADGAQVVADDIAGEWDASHGDGIVVVPSSGSGPDLSDATPAALGTAAAGVSADASRADHVHAIPAIGGSVSLPIWSQDSRDLPSSTAWTLPSAMNYTSTSSPALNDEKFVRGLPYLPPGTTWEFVLIAQGGTGSGKVRLIKDGTPIGTEQTLYAGSTSAVQVVLATGVTGDGTCALSIRTTGAGTGGGYTARHAALHAIRTA